MSEAFGRAGEKLKRPGNMQRVAGERACREKPPVAAAGAYSWRVG
jgi:hypothetical protein